MVAETRTVSPTDLLTFSTTRIETERADGSRGVGTGFLFDLSDAEGTCRPALITNKHVVRGAVLGRFALRLATDEGMPVLSSYSVIEIEEMERRCTAHPEDDVDLCALPLAPVFQKAEKSQQKLFGLFSAMGNLIEEEDRDELSAVESVLMIGYPNGLWDAKNHLPICRCGVTATHPGIPYQGRRELLIDIACFPGSSGSPVFLFDPSAKTRYRTKNGREDFPLLGVLYAGPVMDVDGNLVFEHVPTSPRVTSRVFINLGIAIWASELRGFLPLIAQIPTY